MLLETVRGLRQRKIDCMVALPRKSSGGSPLQEALEGDGVRVIRRSSFILQKHPGFRRALLMPFILVLDILRIAHLIHQLKPDLVYVNTLAQPTWMVASRLCRRRTLCHVREAEDQLPRIVSILLTAPLYLVNGIACNSVATMKYLRQNPLLSRRPMKVIYNGKDWAPYYSAPARFTKSGPLRLGLVGRLNPRKGQDLALAALAELEARGLIATLQLAGDVFPGYEWYEENLRKEVARRGLQDRVNFLGFIREVPDVLKEIDILLVPSRVEPFGTVAAEGQAAGRLVITANTGGLTEIVNDGETGLTFTVGEGSSLANRLIFVAENPQAASDLAARGQQSCLSRFSSSAYIDAVASFCAEIAS
jgi:glycosyltransferase involved in cell wall biosynthesis